MTKIVNLNKFRKTQNRKSKERQAEMNRVKFGQTKVEKTHNEYKKHHEDQELSGKKINDEGTDLA